MADFTALKSAIQTYIKQNGNEEITGEKLQEILLSMVTILGDIAINDLVTALANEVAARQNADGTLQQNITNEATARGNEDTDLSNRLGSSITADNTAADQIGAEAEARAAADTALQLLIDGITDNIENGYVYAGIATPSSTPATGKVFYLALTAGTYTNFGNTEVSQGINILKFNGSAWSLDAFIGIDDELTPSSNNLPKSGNVLENIIKNGSAFDLSAYNAEDGVLATYTDLDAALAALNLLPAVYKQGGMSFRFVRTSDNKYVQFRYMGTAVTGTPNPFLNTANWQGVDDEPTAGSDNLVKSGGIVYTIGGEYKIFPTIEQGTLAGNGNTQGSSTRLRTSDFIVCDSITINPGLGKVSVFGYSDNAFISYNDWETTTKTYKINGATKYKIVFAYLDNTDITVEDFEGLGTNVIIKLIGNQSFETGEKLSEVSIASSPLVDKTDEIVKNQVLFDALNTFVPSIKESLSPSLISEGYALIKTGQCVQDSNSKLVKYIVSAGQCLYLKLSKDNDAVFQFQDSSTVPSPPLTNVGVIGGVHTEQSAGFVIVPEGATYLIVSQLKTNSSNIISIVYNSVEQKAISNSKNLISSGTVFGVKQDVIDISKNFAQLLVGNYTTFNIIQGIAIGENGTEETNSNYSCTKEIALINGRYILFIDKTDTAGVTRIHGYKNGVWVKQIDVIPSVNVGKLNVTFSIDNTEIDSIRISYSHFSTSLVRLQNEKTLNIFELDINLEKGSYTADTNRYGLLTSNELWSYINQKPIILNSASSLLIPSRDILGVNLNVYFRDVNGDTISSVAIINVDKDILLPTPNNAYYLDIEISKLIAIFDEDTAAIVEGKAINASGEVETNSDYSYVDSIDVTDGEYILEITKSGSNGITRIHGYKNGSWVKQIGIIDAGSSGVITTVFEITNNEIDTIKVSYNNGSTEVTNIYSVVSFDKETLASFYYNCSEQPKEGKRIYVNSNNPIINPFTVGGPDNLLSCMCYMLPPNYSHNGTKVPLIIWFDGSGGYPNLTSTFQANKLPGLSYMRDEGFAVMQVFAWGAEYSVSCPGCGKDMPYPTRTCLRSIKSAIEFMVDRYNIDGDNVHVVSKSFGGIISSYFTMFPIWKFKSIGMFSPCIDVLSMRGRFLGGRLALIQDLNLQGDYVEDFKDISESGQTQSGVDNYFFSPRCQNLWLDNFTKLMSINAAWIRVCEAGYNEKYQQSIADAQAWWDLSGETPHGNYNADVYNNTDRHRIGKVPCKLWIGTHDVDTPHQIMIEFVEQLKNSGSYAEASIIEDGGHSTPDFGYGEEVTTKLGIHYDSVAIGWRENIKWIRRNSVGEI